MNIRALAMFACGYVLFYYGLNILVHAYFGQAGAALNPPGLATLFGIPGAATTGDAGSSGDSGSTPQPASNPGISDNLNIPNPLTGSSGQ